MDMVTKASSRSCNPEALRFNTNTNGAFGSLIGKAFHSDFTVLGWSGQGMVRNYGESSKKSATPYPYYYDSTLGTLPGDWDFTNLIPDLVVICLCTNDFSTTPYPDDTMFIDAYHQFISRILENYHNPEILCVSTHTGPSDDYLQRVVDEEVSEQGHQNVHYSGIPIFPGNERM